MKFNFTSRVQTLATLLLFLGLSTITRAQLKVGDNPTSIQK